MKKLLMAAFFTATATVAFAQQEQRKSPHVTAESKDIKVVYGQPSKNGREIFGKLVPFGQVWRAGADEATEITFAKDATFGGKPVKAGTYTLFTIPEQKEWTIILNTTLKQWGAYSYDKIKDKNVLEVKVPAEKVKAPVEKLTYTVGAKSVDIAWDETKVAIPVK
ncbi:DUF2911 domain-containing protein [Chitinophaga sp. Hz27]|uniref:DUF2911 domain-containing protein n=1 Tax=Chitinophaga sp. Hz27 TaxID=3347169 RepID=UPI0035D8511D